MNLEGRFQQEMLRIYEETMQFGYYPNCFLRMVVDRQPNTCSAAISCRMDLSDCGRNNVLTS